jgi:hypothetical protein
MAKSVRSGRFGQKFDQYGIVGCDFTEADAPVVGWELGVVSAWGSEWPSVVLIAVFPLRLTSLKHGGRLSKRTARTRNAPCHNKCQVTMREGPWSMPADLPPRYALLHIYF